MIHIKETEIIPLLKEAQTEYSQKITEGDPKDVEMAERIEEALTQAMDTSCTTTRAWQMSISGWSKNTRQKHQ